MNTLDLDALQRFTEQARRLQSIAADLQPFLEPVKKLDGRNFAPADRLIRAGEAAQILGVSKSAIGEFCRAELKSKLCWTLQAAGSETN